MEKSEGSKIWVMRKFAEKAVIDFSFSNFQREKQNPHQIQILHKQHLKFHKNFLRYEKWKKISHVEKDKNYPIRQNLSNFLFEIKI